MVNVLFSLYRRACCYAQARRPHRHSRRRRRHVPRRSHSARVQAAQVDAMPSHTRFVLLIRRLRGLAPYNTLEEDVPSPPPYDQECVPPPSYEQAISGHTMDQSNASESHDVQIENEMPTVEQVATISRVDVDGDDELIDLDAEPKLENEEVEVSGEINRFHDLPPPYSRV